MSDERGTLDGVRHLDDHRTPGLLVPAIDFRAQPFGRGQSPARPGPGTTLLPLGMIHTSDGMACHSAGLILDASNRMF